MAVKKPTNSKAQRPKPYSGAHDRRAETLELARQLAIATISVGIVAADAEAARGHVKAAREMLDELDHPTPLPEKSKAPHGHGGRPGNSSGMGAPDDLLGELNA